MTSRVYVDLSTMFALRGVGRLPDGSFWEDSYDYGVWWLDRERRGHRLTWIGPVRRPDPSSAGELYLVRHDGTGTGPVELLCIIPPVGDKPPYDSRVEEILVGWAEACGTPGSVDWVRDRAREAIEAGWASAP